MKPQNHPIPGLSSLSNVTQPLSPKVGHLRTTFTMS